MNMRMFLDGSGGSTDGFLTGSSGSASPMLYADLALFSIRRAFFMLFVIMIINVVLGSETNVTFTYMLQSLSESPSIDISWITTITEQVITDDWGIFNFFRNFLNSFIKIISFALYFVTGVAQLFVYVAYIIRVFLGI